MDEVLEEFERSLSNLQEIRAALMGKKKYRLAAAVDLELAMVHERRYRFLESFH